MAQENQRGFFGIIIPKEVLDDTDLSIAEKFIFGYIASFTKCCFESSEAIATKLGVSESTISHALPKLSEKGYIFVEKVNNSNNLRRVYSVLDNPKKLAYLVKKGMFKPVENSASVRQNMPNEEPTVRQNLLDVRQNMPNDLTGVRSAKFADIDIEEKKNKVETPGLAIKKPAGPYQIKKADFDNPEDYEKAFYERNTVRIGAD